MSDILKAFNNHLISFISDIITIFPDKKCLKVTRTALETWKKLNPKSLIAAWKLYIVDLYQKEIEMGDGSFFIDKNYVADLSGCNNTNNILAAIENLREPLRDMGENNKKKAIKYVQNLSKLCILYYRQVKI